MKQSFEDFVKSFATFVGNLLLRSGKRFHSPEGVRRQETVYRRPQLNGPALLREFNGASRRKRITKTRNL
jgi:hypothetical protein